MHAIRIILALHCPAAQFLKIRKFKEPVMAAMPQPEKDKQDR